MSKKFFSIVLCFLFFLFSLSGETILVAPVVVYDKESKRIETKEDPSVIMCREFSSRWFEGLIHFENLGRKKYGEILNILDASRVCTAENVEFMLYGYIQNNEGNWFGNIKLYDSQKKKIIKEFYCADSLEHYERFLASLAHNILEEITELTGIESDTLNKTDIRPVELTLPVSLFYWTPVDPKWNSRILGIAGTEIAAEFYPQQPLISIKEKQIDFSIRLVLFWDCGINQRKCFPLFMNNISVYSSAVIHVHFDKQHSVYAGAGPGYALELIKIEPKYEDPKLYYQNAFYVECLSGYEFCFNDKLNFFAENALAFYMTGGQLVTIKQKLGVSFHIFGGSK